MGLPLSDLPSVSSRVLLSAFLVVVELRVFVAALVLQEYEPVGVRGRDGDRLGIESELFAGTQRRGHPVNLLHVAEAGRDEQRAIGLPVGKRASRPFM